MSAFGVPESTGQEPQDSQAVFEEIYPALRRFAAVVADLDIDPDDLVQEALASTLRRHDLSEIQQPLAYLKRAVVNSVSDHRRGAVRRKRFLPKLGDDTATRDSYPSDLAILDALAPQDRAIIYMADVEGQPHAVIAEQLGLTSGAVRKRASRARSQLRRLLEPSINLLSEGQ